MTWEAVGALAELIGAGAVVATLIYLATQVRQNTNAMETSQKVELGRNFNERVQRRIELAKMTAESSELAEILQKLDSAGWPVDLSALDNLTDVERRRVRSINIIQLLSCEIDELERSPAGHLGRCGT